MNTGGHCRLMDSDYWKKKLKRLKKDRIAILRKYRVILKTILKKKFFSEIAKTELRKTLATAGGFAYAFADRLLL